MDEIRCIWYCFMCNLSSFPWCVIRQQDGVCIGSKYNTELMFIVIEDHVTHFNNVHRLCVFNQKNGGIQCSEKAVACFVCTA